MKNIENARKHTFTVPFVIIGSILVITSPPLSNEWLAGWLAIGWGLLRHHPKIDKVTSMKNTH